MLRCQGCWKVGGCCDERSVFGNARYRSGFPASLFSSPGSLTSSTAALLSRTEKPDTAPRLLRAGVWLSTPHVWWFKDLLPLPPLWLVQQSLQRNMELCNPVSAQKLNVLEFKYQSLLWKKCIILVMWRGIRRPEGGGPRGGEQVQIGWPGWPGWRSKTVMKGLKPDLTFLDWLDMMVQNCLKLS